MSAKVSFLVISFLVVLFPWLLWRLRVVRRVAPLAVVQILLGVALGPSLLGRVAPGAEAALFGGPVAAALDGVSSIGVLLYVFVAGLHVKPAGLRKEGARLGTLALGSVAVPFLLGLVAGAWMLAAVPGAAGQRGGQIGFMVAVAICIAVTALPVLAAILREMGLLGERIGQTALTAAAFNDVALWVMLAMQLALAEQDGGAGGLLRLGMAALWFALLVGLGRPLMAWLATLGNEAVLVGGVALALLAAGVSEGLGTGYLIGAFVAGAIVPAACRPTLLGRLEAVTATVLLPFFFMSTGLKAVIAPGSASFLGTLAVALACTVAGKLAGTALPARRLGFSWAESVSLGFLMQTKGLMEVVVLAVLHDAGMLGPQIFSAMVAMAVICTVLTTPAVRLCERLQGGAAARRMLPGDSRTASDMPASP